EKSALPAELSSEDRAMAVWAHLGGCVTYFVAPTILLWLQQDRRSFASWHTREAINFQICILMYLLLAGVLLVGLIVLLVLLLVVKMWLYVVALAAPLLIVEVFKLTVVTVAARAAYRGRWFRCPLTIRFVPHPQAS